MKDKFTDDLQNEALFILLQFGLHIYPYVVFKDDYRYGVET